MANISQINGFGLYAQTASFANTASLANTASFALTSSLVLTSSFAQTASFANTASFALSASSVSTASFASTASYILQAVSASFASTASFTPNALTTASVSLNTITFTKDDGSTFPITINTGSSSPASAVTQSFRLQATTFTIPGSSGNRFTPVSAFLSTGAESPVQLYVEQAMTLRQIIIRTTNAQPSTGNYTITLRKNGVDTSLAVTILANTAASVLTTTADVSLVVGDLIAYRLNNAATTTSTNIAQISLLYF